MSSVQEQVERAVQLAAALPEPVRVLLSERSSQTKRLRESMRSAWEVQRAVARWAQRERVKLFVSQWARLARYL